MKIHAFNFTCHRDRELSELMETTIYKYCPHDVSLKVVNTDTDPKYARYGNGAGWEAGMMKIAYMKTISFADDDWVLSVDSDVVFGNRKVFDLLDPKYGIIGIQGQQPWDTFYGKWAHMSGCLIFLRGDIARQMTLWQPNTFDAIRQNHFKEFSITENEDVMLSYFARMQGAEEFDVSSVPGITSNDFEQDVNNGIIIEQTFKDDIIVDLDRSEMASFYHLNYCPTQFLGEPVTGKWDLPSVLKKKGIDI
jgi:hypothetical protein